MASNTENEFHVLGSAIAAARIAAGLAKQSDLAGILSVSQQTVSRWEAGVAKPKEKQLLALAVVLKLNVADLRRLTHDEEVSAVSYVEPFPVDRLDPTTFESFVADLAEAMYPNAEVRRAGGTGHTQDGLDIVVIFPDGKKMGLQCKRVQRFGPANAKAAISAFPASGYEKVLVLSLVASPQTAKTMKAAGWTVWDKDDLSRRVRRLPVETQERLVDIYFRGQRLALLGRSEPGPWLTTEEFFRPFAGADSLLSHDWDMLGRESETDDLLAALVRPGVRMALLVAAGGMGKSRLLKESMALLAQSEPFTRIRFLSSAADLSRGALDDLGPGPKVIVVDDAHDRDRLSLLFEYASDQSRQVRLVLATRPYALDRIKHEAARFNIISSPTITLQRLSRKQSRALADQILARFGIHDVRFAGYVVDASGNSPLIVAMASRALARDRIPVEIAQNESAFRKLVLSRFKQIAIHIADAGDQKAHQDVLGMLALVQPFHPEDRQLLNALEQVQNVPTEVAARILDRLAKGGATYRRGHEWRLMPDVLGDYLIEESCLISNRLSAFAERTLDSLRHTLLKHALVNLSRLDWRLNEGRTADSVLLDGIWRKLENIDDEFDPRLDVVKAIALYQPSQALQFVAQQMRRKRKFRAFSAILRGIAQTSDYLRDVMTLLWELGRDDEKELGPHPDHPIRILSELGDYSGGKPIIYSGTLLDFGMSLVEDARNWRSRYTPLDILKPLLSLEGMDNSSDGRTISLRPYFINYNVVRPLRTSVVSKIIQLLRHANVSIAYAAASHLQDAVRYPLGLMGSAPPEGLRTALSEEFARTFDQVRDTLIEGVDPLVALALARSVAWNARHAGGRSSVSAQRILDSLPNDLDFRVLTSLVDGWGSLFSDWNDSDSRRSDQDHRLTEVAIDLQAAKPDTGQRFIYLNQMLSQLGSVGADLSTAHLFVAKLTQNDAFSRTIVDEALTRKDSLARQYVGLALFHLLQKSESEGRSYARQFIDSGDRTLSIAAVHAYSASEITDEDKPFFQRLLRSNDIDVVREALRTVWLWRKIEDRERVKLLLTSKYSQSVELIDSLAMVFCDQGAKCVSIMTESDISCFLSSITKVDRLEGYWIDELLGELSCRFPYVMTDFLMRRVETAARSQSFAFRPVNYGPYSSKPLRFYESSEALGILKVVWTWLQAHPACDCNFRRASAHLIEAMFPQATRFLVEFFYPRLQTAEKNDLLIIGRIFEHVDHQFIFDHVDFVAELLGRCQIIDSDLYQGVMSCLYAGERSGMRTSMPGEPSPRDLATKDRAEETLRKLSLLSPAYELFDNIRKSALADIDRAKRDAEAFDD